MPAFLNLLLVLSKVPRANLVDIRLAHGVALALVRNEAVASASLLDLSAALLLRLLLRLLFLLTLTLKRPTNSHLALALHLERALNRRLALPLSLGADRRFALHRGGLGGASGLDRAQVRERETLLLV